MRNFSYLQRDSEKNVFHVGTQREREAFEVGAWKEKQVRFCGLVPISRTNEKETARKDREEIKGREEQWYN